MKKDKKKLRTKKDVLKPPIDNLEHPLRKLTVKNSVTKKKLMN